MRRLENFAVMLILFHVILLTVPPLFKDTVYFSNVFFTILFSGFAFSSFAIPFYFKRLGIIIKTISNLVGGWWVSGLIFEIVNFFMPEMVLNDVSNNLIYPKILIAFSLSLVFIFTSHKWSRQ